jgi:hypothetical protein
MGRATCSGSASQQGLMSQAMPSEARSGFRAWSNPFAFLTRSSDRGAGTSVGDRPPPGYATRPDRRRASPAYITRRGRPTQQGAPADAASRVRKAPFRDARPPSTDGLAPGVTLDRRSSRSGGGGKTLEANATPERVDASQQDLRSEPLSGNTDQPRKACSIATFQSVQRRSRRLETFRFYVPGMFSGATPG